MVTRWGCRCWPSARPGRRATADPLTPDLVGTLVRRFVEIVPSGLHRRALEVCAIARVTTEGLLREVLAVDDAHDPFSWLRGLSFWSRDQRGRPARLARDALEADLRWRDPAGYRDVFRAVRSHINGRLRTTRHREQQRAISDAKYMFRRLPGVVSPLDWDVWGQQYPEPARPPTGKRSWTWSWALRGRRRRRSQRCGGSNNPRASSWSETTTGSSPASWPSWSSPAPHPVWRPTPESAAWDHAQRQAPPRPNETVTQTRL